MTRAERSHFNPQRSLKKKSAQRVWHQISMIALHICHRFITWGWTALLLSCASGKLGVERNLKATEKTWLLRNQGVRLSTRGASMVSDAAATSWAMLWKRLSTLLRISRQADGKLPIRVLSPASCHSRCASCWLALESFIPIPPGRCLPSSCSSQGHHAALALLFHGAEQVPCEEECLRLHCAPSPAFPGAPLQQKSCWTSQCVLFTRNAFWNILTRPCKNHIGFKMCFFQIFWTRNS